jgi:alpha-L-fucosidase
VRPPVVFVVLCAALVLVPAAPARRAKAPFGLFIHYGPSALVNAPNQTDWMRGVWSTGYPQLVSGFHPNPSAVTQWVALARASGASYVTFTAKHHDGYTLWHTSAETDAAAGASNWGVPADEDLLAALASACRAAHLKLYVYFSLPDWYSHWYRVANADHFLPIAEAQLTELLTHYGPLAGVWLDGTWDRPDSFWHLDELIALIHRLQPKAEVGVNRQPAGPGEDFSIFESSFPAGRPTARTEVTYPIGSQWFYSTLDAPHTHAWVVQLRAHAARLGLRLLLDVPPRADGSFDPADVAALLGHPLPAPIFPSSRSTSERSTRIAAADGSDSRS